MLIPMEVSLAILADAANVSQEGKLNILGAFNNIYARTFPATHPTMQLVLRFHATPAERGIKRRATIKLLDADANEVFSLGTDLTVPEQPGRPDADIATIIGLNNVTFQRPGDYVFSILLDNDEKRTVPFKVIQREQLQLPM